MRIRFLNTPDAAHAASLAADELGPDSHVVEAGAEGAFAGLAEGGGTGGRLPNGPASVVERALLRHGASPMLVQAILTERRIRRARNPLTLLTGGLKATIGFGRLPRAGTARLLLLGPPAAGKTTLIAKLAARGPANRNGASAIPPTILSADTTREGGLEQLATVAQVLGIRIQPIDAADPTHAGLVALAAKSVLIDTPAVSAHSTEGLAALARLALRAQAEPILVLPAEMDGAEAGALARAAAGIGVRRFMVTRLELARGLSPVIAACEAGLILIGGAVTPHFAYGLRPFTPTLLARRLLATAAENALWQI
jgi:flagellar biosynthesis protein FlhF